MAMAGCKNDHGGAAAALALKISCFRRLDTICGAVVIFALVAAGFLVSSTPPGDVFLPVLGANLLTDSRTLHVDVEEKQERQVVDHAFIQNVVALPEEVLFLIKTPPFYRFPQPNKLLTCVFDNDTEAEVRGIDRQIQKSAIRCDFVLDKVLSSSRAGFLPKQVVSLKDADSGVGLLSKQVQLFRWNFLAFEAVITPQDLVLFAKGILTRRSQHRKISDFKCVFDGRIETKVTSAAQEVFRCAHPPQPWKKTLAGKKVTLSVNGKSMPSVAYYEQQDFGNSGVSSSKYFICSCTMVFNIAKFLKEWVIYHAKLGVERFFFYDNNSEDDLRDVLEELKLYNVSRHFWPWMKSQEAGFSHCALRAQSECTWMVYTDVDEFIFPKAWLRKSSRPLTKMIQDVSDPRVCKRCKRGLLGGFWKTSRKVGQIFLSCRVFGPSGLSKHPAAGVTRGYICRTSKLQRHKSIVLLEALDGSLLNVVHHFQLKADDYVNSSISSWKGVIAHYKYQVWEEFKTKFRRRVSAYVSDWKQQRNLDSNDRTPGLGTQEIEPPNWRHKFCDVNDTELRSYVIKAFSSKKGGMIWQ